MRTLLRNFIAWMDKRFPEKVVITQAEFLALRAQIDVLSKSVSEERIKKIEQEINKFNVSMGFAGTTTRGAQSMTQQFQR